MPQPGLYPRFRADDRDGNPLAGGKLYSYLAGTSTPAALYADAALTQALPNPLLLDSSGEATFYYNGQAYKLTLTDAQDVPQWTLDPVGGGLAGGSGVVGLGFGSNTVALTPLAGQAQAQALVFPADVLALGLTLWVEESLGTSQGLEAVGVGHPDLPDCWGLLTDLTADSGTTAGWFLGYGGQPQPTTGQVTLTAYGGLFDGAGRVYVTGYFLHFSALTQVGMAYLPGSGGDVLTPPPAVTLATETAPGIVELVDATEVLAETDVTRAVTIGRLVSRTATETRVGLVELATATETTTGTDATRAVTPAGLAAKVPSGTALSVPRYAAGGTALEGTGWQIDSAQNLLGPAASKLLVNTTDTTQPVRGYLAGDATAAGLRLTRHSADNAGAGLTILKSRGTESTPSVVQLNDILSSVNLGAYTRDAANTTSTYLNLAVIRAYVSAVDAQNRADSTLQFFTTEASATATEKLRITPAGNVLLALTTVGTGARGTLALGPGVAPSTSPTDSVQLTAIDRGGTAGKRSLHLRTEDGTSHVLGDLAGIATTLSATLGSGASYQALSVNGSQLFVGPSSVQERAQALLSSTWVSSTDATRTARLVVSAYDATAAREGLRLEADGTAARLGFYGATAVTQPTVTGSRAGNAALASALTALASLGLITDSSTA